MKIPKTTRRVGVRQSVPKAKMPKLAKTPKFPKLPKLKKLKAY